MKKNGTSNLIFLAGLYLLLAGCQLFERKQDADDSGSTHTERLYTCPMHPQIVQPHPGTCPVCGMELVPRHIPGTETPIDSTLQHLLKPVNEQVITDIATIRVTNGMQIISVAVQGVINYDLRNKRSISSRVTGRIEKLYIRYNYQPVKKGQLIMEIYSPDLAAAQRELLLLGKQHHENNLLSKAKERLLLLGLTEQNIAHIIQSGEVMYRIPVYSSADGLIVESNSLFNSNNTPIPTSGTAQSDMAGMTAGNLSGDKYLTNNPATSVMLREGQYISAGESMFTIIDNRQLIAEFYFSPDIVSHVSTHQSILFSTMDNPDKMYNGKIGLIQPAFNNGVPFSVARVYLNPSRLAPGQLITGSIPLVSTGKWLPQQAVYHTGNQAIVFKKEGKVFIPNYVKTGSTVGEMVEIMEPIDDWIVASNAAYLIDSESYIKASNNNTR